MIDEQKRQLKEKKRKLDIVFWSIFTALVGLAIGVLIGSSFNAGSLEDDGWVRYDEVFGEIAADIEQCFQPEEDGKDYWAFLGLQMDMDRLMEDNAMCRNERVDISRELTICMRDLTSAEREAKMWLGAKSDIQYDAVNAENKLLFCKNDVDRLESMLNPPEDGYCYLRTWPDECSPLCAPGSCPP